MALKPYLVDDGGIDSVVLIWAERSVTAKAIARKEYGEPQRESWEWHVAGPDRPKWDAEVYEIKLEGVSPPSEAGFESRENVLEQACSHIRPY